VADEITISVKLAALEEMIRNRFEGSNMVARAVDEAAYECGREVFGIAKRSIIAALNDPTLPAAIEAAAREGLIEGARSEAQRIGRRKVRTDNTLFGGNDEART
jgi:hypothetical protein